VLISSKRFRQGQSNATAGAGYQACFYGTFFQNILLDGVIAI
jgi:hypothetical protein